jgi:hypothetical protein
MHSPSKIGRFEKCTDEREHSARKLTNHLSRDMRLRFLEQFCCFFQFLLVGHGFAGRLLRTLAEM